MTRGPLVSLLLRSSCGLRDYVPAGPTLKNRGVERWLGSRSAESPGCAEPRVDFPAIPSAGRPSS